MRKHTAISGSEEQPVCRSRLLFKLFLNFKAPLDRSGLELLEQNKANRKSYNLAAFSRVYLESEIFECCVTFKLKMELTVSLA